MKRLVLAVILLFFIVGIGVADLLSEHASQINFTISKLNRCLRGIRYLQLEKAGDIPLTSAQLDAVVTQYNIITTSISAITGNLAPIQKQ